jgi:hypothetical protein
MECIPFIKYGISLKQSTGGKKHYHQLSFIVIHSIPGYAVQISNFRMPAYSPTDACRNFDPILESRPTARATSEMSAPVASHTADSELILDIL